MGNVYVNLDMWLMRRSCHLKVRGTFNFRVLLAILFRCAKLFSQFSQRAF